MYRFCDRTDSMVSRSFKSGERSVRPVACANSFYTPREGNRGDTRPKAYTNDGVAVGGAEISAALAAGATVADVSNSTPSTACSPVTSISWSMSPLLSTLSTLPSRPASEPEEPVQRLGSCAASRTWLDSGTVGGPLDHIAEPNLLVVGQEAGKPDLVPGAAAARARGTRARVVVVARHALTTYCPFP